MKFSSNAASAGEKPDLIVDPGDLPSAAREVGNILASCGWIFDRGGPVKVTAHSGSGLPTVERLSAEAIVQEVHRLRRPVRLAKNGTLLPVTLPIRVARMYLNMPDEWSLRPLNGVSATPVLTSEGSIGICEGYDSATGIWLANIPSMRIPDRPTRAEAAAALHLLRHTFRTFAFADSERRWDPELGTEVIDLDLPAGDAESAFILALLTAVCRSSLPLAPVLISRPWSRMTQTASRLRRCLR